MKCPKCNGKTRTNSTIHYDKKQYTWRNKICTKCDFHFSTYEIIRPHDIHKKSLKGYKLDLNLPIPPNDIKKQIIDLINKLL